VHHLTSTRRIPHSSLVTHRIIKVPPTSPLAVTEPAADRSPHPTGNQTAASLTMTLESAFDLRERQRIRMPEIALAITNLWISLVPSKMV
jgi:hypothetical protein